MVGYYKEICCARIKSLRVRNWLGSDAQLRSVDCQPILLSYLFSLWDYEPGAEHKYLHIARFTHKDKERERTDSALAHCWSWVTK